MKQSNWMIKNKLQGGRFLKTEYKLHIKGQTNIEQNFEEN